LDREGTALGHTDELEWRDKERQKAWAIRGRALVTGSGVRFGAGQGSEGEGETILLKRGRGGKSSGSHNGMVRSCSARTVLAGTWKSVRTGRASRKASDAFGVGLRN